MNLYKIAEPDTPLGRLLLSARADFQMLGLQLRGNDAATMHAARALRKLVPRYTMLSMARLVKLYELGYDLALQKRSGSVVECGVWNGGSAAAIAAGWSAARATESLPPFWLFDSFEGLPEPTERDEDSVREGFFEGWCKGSQDAVVRAQETVGLSSDHLQIIPGWFDQTLAQNADAIGPVDLLHVDADWYDSVWHVLEVFYPRVVSGGIIVFDDYNRWAGCRDAVRDYCEKFDLPPLDFQPIDNHAVMVEKP